jgi:hypothetical protein
VVVVWWERAAEGNGAKDAALRLLPMLWTLPLLLILLALCSGPRLSSTCEGCSEAAVGRGILRLLQQLPMSVLVPLLWLLSTAPNGDMGAVLYAIAAGKLRYPSSSC